MKKPRMPFVNIRFTIAEMLTMRAEADSCDMPLSTWIRNILLHHLNIADVRPGPGRFPLVPALWLRA